MSRMSTSRKSKWAECRRQGRVSDLGNVSLKVCKYISVALDYRLSFTVLFSFSHTPYHSIHLLVWYNYETLILIIKNEGNELMLILMFRTIVGCWIFLALWKELSSTAVMTREAVSAWVDCGRSIHDSECFSSNRLLLVSRIAWKRKKIKTILIQIPF